MLLVTQNYFVPGYVHDENALISCYTVWLLCLKLLQGC